MCKAKKIKKIKKRIDRSRTPEQQQWEMTTRIVTHEMLSSMSKRMKGIKNDDPGNQQWR